MRSICTNFWSVFLAILLINCLISTVCARSLPQYLPSQLSESTSTVVKEVFTGPACSSVVVSDETQDKKRHTVQVAALECSEGTVQWMYPRGQIHLSVRPKPSIFTHHYSRSTPGDKSLSNLLASRSSAPNEMLSSFDRTENENSGRQPKMTFQEQNTNQNANSEYEHGKSFDAVRVCLRVRNSPSSSRHPALQDDVAIVLSNGRKMSPVRVREAARKRELICETLVVNLDLNPAVYTFRIQHHNLGAGMKTECTSCQTSNVHSNSNESSVILDYFVKWI